MRRSQPLNRCTITEARDRLPRLVRAAERGTPVALTRRGRPVAVLLSRADYDRLATGRGDFWDRYVAFRLRFDGVDLDAESFLDSCRDRRTGRDFRW